MKAVVLDGYTLNPGDLSWEGVSSQVEGFTLYDGTPQELAAQRIGDCEIVFTNKVEITREVMEACPSVKMVGLLATGYNIVDIAEAARRGIDVCNVPSYSTPSVAQMTFALLLEIVPVGNPDRRILENALLRQIESLAKYQDEGGMWHTLIDDPTSYLEASATSGFGFGILKAVEQGIVPESYRANAMRALQPVLDCIDEKGVVQQVSYGTPMGRESKDFYKQIPLHPMPYGQAMAILFLMEAEAQV